MLRFELIAHVWKAFRIVACHVGDALCAFSSRYRLLGLPPASVPSGAKLSVRWPGSGHAWPQTPEGVSRSSSSSTVRRRVLFILASLFLTVRGAGSWTKVFSPVSSNFKTRVLGV